MRIFASEQMEAHEPLASGRSVAEHTQTYGGAIE